MFRIFIRCCFLVFVGLNNVNAQTKSPQEKLDSLLLVDKNHQKEDSMKVVIFKQMYLQYMKLKNFDKVEEYVDKTINTAQKIGLKWYVANAYYNRGMFYHGKTNYQKAEENYKKAVDKFIEIKDLDWIAGTYLNMGALYSGIPDYARALEVNQKAIPIYQQLNDDGSLASCYANVAEIYQSLGQQVNALGYLEKALKIFLKGEDTRGVAVAYNFMGAAYFKATDDELIKLGINPSQRNTIALANLNKGIKAGQAINDATVLGPLHEKMGNVYEAMGNKDLALSSYLKALEFNDQQDDKSSQALTLLSLSDFYEKSEQYQKSEPLLLNALKIGQDNKLLEIQQNAYLRLSTIAEKQGNYNKSLTYYRQYISFKEQIFNQEKEKEITRRQLQLDFSIKEKDYQVKQQLTDGELQRQVLLAKQQQQQLVLRKQELALSDKEKSLQRLTFLKKQADLENEKRFQQEMLDQEQLKAKLKDNEIGLQKTELRVNRNINISLGILAAILFASALFVFYAQRRTAKLNKIVSEQKIELEKLGKVKDRIFSVVSHDMRTPVNSLISFIQLLEGGSISQEKLTKYAANLKNTLGYTSAMMENLLNWASSQMEGYKPIIEKFDIELCVKEVINALQITANQKQITIENEIKSGILCLADMNMTSLVLRNLMSNAIKFTPNNGLIKITASSTAQAVLLNVSDSGIGLSAAQLIRFNQPGNLETGESTMGTNQEKGTGIGLTLCKTFTNLMNGSLSAISTPNEGSVFTLKLPK